MWLSTSAIIDSPIQEGQTETAHLFWITLTPFTRFKKLPTPVFILLVPGLTVFRQEEKGKLQPAG